MTISASYFGIVIFINTIVSTHTAGQNLPDQTIRKALAQSSSNGYPENHRDQRNRPRLVEADTVKSNVYFLSGLGAHERTFEALKLNERISIRHIEWIRPLKKETLRHYAGRLTTQIDTTKPFQLVGLSFGGVMASELSEIIDPSQIIIISSTSTGIPIGGFYRGLLKIFLFHPLAGPLLKSANKVTYRFFGADTPQLKSLLKDILHDTDSRLLKWALIQMSGWNRKTKVSNLYHIHGNADKLIPINLVHPDVVIEGGGHLMILRQHEEISRILNSHLH